MNRLFFLIRPDDEEEVGPWIGAGEAPPPLGEPQTDPPPEGTGGTSDERG